MARAIWKPSDIYKAAPRRGRPPSVDAAAAAAPVPKPPPPEPPVRAEPEPRVPAPSAEPALAPVPARLRVVETDDAGPKAEPELDPEDDEAVPGKAHGRSRRTDDDVLVDRHVGQRVKLRRKLLGLSQEQLAARLGVTFQQVQKYENGANRIGASLLFRVSRALDVPVSFFFDGLDVEGPSLPPMGGDGHLSRRALDLVRHYEGIEDEAVKQEVYRLVKALTAPQTV